jgi:hypothetical protein
MGKKNRSIYFAGIITFAQYCSKGSSPFLYPIRDTVNVPTYDLQVPGNVRSNASCVNIPSSAYIADISLQRGLFFLNSEFSLSL